MHRPQEEVLLQPIRHFGRSNIAGMPNLVAFLEDFQDDLIEKTVGVGE